MHSRDSSLLGRRVFCRTSLFAGGAIVWQPLSASILRANTPAASSKIDPAIANFVLSYASAYFLQGGSVLGATAGTTTAGVHVVAQVDSFDALTSVWESQKATMRVYASGNFLSYTDANGQFVSVENLLPADYAARRQDLAAGTNIRFVHEALTYTPSTAGLSDPFKVMSRSATRRLQVLPQAVTADPVSTVLHGLVDAARFGLTADGSFAALRDQTFATPAATQESARTVEAFVMALPALVAAGAGNSVASLLGTPRLSSSLAAAYGITANRAARNYQQLRAATDASFGDGAVWLATLLGKSFQQGTIGLAAADADPFVTAQARVALADARQIVSQVTFL